MRKTKYCLTLIAELELCCDWLRTNQEPWELVMENWKKTFSLRKNDGHMRTVSEYFQKWPILKHKDAHQLVRFLFLYIV